MTKPKAKDSDLYCVHGLKREHVVSGGGTLCGGPFRWEMTPTEARSQSDYYREYEKFYHRDNK